MAGSITGNVYDQRTTQAIEGASLKASGPTEASGASGSDPENAPERINSTSNVTSSVMDSTDRPLGYGPAVR